MTDFEDLKQLISLIYIIPSLILYFIVLHIILFSQVKNQYTASFYWIFSFSAFNYIIHSISYYIIYRFSRIPLFQTFLQSWPTESIFYPIIYTIMYYTAYANHTYSLIISFNRFTIFILKLKYNNFWKKNLKYFLCFCVFSPLIFIWTFPFIAIQNQPIPGSFAYIVPTISTFASWMNRSRNLFIEISFTSISSLLMNIYVIFSMVHWRYYSTNNSNIQLSSQDFTMILYSMLIFLTEAFSCMQQFMLTIDRETFLGFVTSTQFILADVSTLAPVWFILATNQQLRQDVFKFFNIFPKTNLHIIQISSVTPQNVSVLV